MADEPSEHWDGERAERWIQMADAVEAQLAPVSAELFAAAGLRPGERVVDVGCGTGPTTRRAAQLVAPGGRVVGADVSTAMIEAAATRFVDRGSSPIDWVVADVASWQPDEPFDAVISRFGVMFFDDPPVAFANLARATAPGGRMCVVVWGRREESELFDRPLTLAVGALASRGVSVAPPPASYGPFSMNDPTEVASMLERAGWRDVTWDRRSLSLLVGGGTGPEDAAETSMNLGPTRIVTQDLRTDDAAAVRRAIADGFGTNLDGNGHVALGATIGVVTATRPADE